MEKEADTIYDLTPEEKQAEGSAVERETREEKATSTEISDKRATEAGEAGIASEGAKKTGETSDSEETKETEKAEKADQEGAEPEKSEADRELERLLREKGSEELLSLLRKGERRDKDVAEAEIRGETAGRNARIEELLDRISADRTEIGDLSSGNSADKKPRSIFDLAEIF